MPSLPDNEETNNPRLASLVAINIVTQVLDEAEEILNIANDSGKSWRFIRHQKQEKERCYVNNEIIGILDMRVNDFDINTSELIQSENVIVTSTPQKETREIARTYNESGIIGQGDEEIEMKNEDVRSPLMLINCLFDMGEEQETIIEVFDYTQIGNDPQDLVASTIAQLVDSYVNKALNVVCGDVVYCDHEGMVTIFKESDISSYSLLSDVLIRDDTENENTATIKDVTSSDTEKEQCVSKTLVKKADHEDMKEITNKEIDLYEKTFVTLNCAYEKYSGDEDLLVDGTSLSMQEVELPTNKSSEVLAAYSEPTQKNEDVRSPSMLINCLFDMGEEQETIIKVFDYIQIGTDPQDLVASTIAQLVGSYVNKALNVACENVVNCDHEGMVKSFEENNISSYSLLSDVLISDDTENENTATINDVASSDTEKEQCVSTTLVKKANDEDMKEITNKEIDFFEKTFLTLNRDYEKYSEDEDLLADETSSPMQEVELPTNKSSEELAAYSEPPQGSIEVAETWEQDPLRSMKVVRTDKNSLVGRCRLQGAKLMSRIRSWWWRQRLIGKRKGSMGVCPLTPEARTRAASLLDHRKLRSPSPSRTLAWKFNTINEALIHSYNMNGFELKINSASVEKD